MTEDNLEEMLERVLNKKRVVDNETHAIHHKFIQAYMERWERRQLLLQKFKHSFVGALAISMFGGLIWIGKAILEYISNGHHP